MATHELISVDDHIIEHPRVWLDRAPDSIADRVPQIVEEGNREVWRYDGATSTNVGLNAVAGKDPSEYGMEPARFSEMRPGCYNIADRIKDMDLDGVKAQLCFGSYGGFVGRTFLEGSDKELGLWCIQAYNDYILDEWCAYAPGRQIPLMTLPLWDVELAVYEARRTAEKGAKALSFSENPAHLGLPTWHKGYWDPLFAFAEESGIPLCLHIGSSGNVPKPSKPSSQATWVVLTPSNSMSAATDLVFSEVFFKFPGLKVALSEGGVGWVPNWLERCEWVYDRHRFWTKINADIRPTELFQRNIWVCCIDDRFGIEMRQRIGVDKIMWECDYPHSDSLWPKSQDTVKAMLRGVPEDEARLIRSENARRLFNFWS